MKIDYADFKHQGISSKFKDRIYDLIIIGSGPAAITLYKKFISKNKNRSKILILEEGDFKKKSYKSVLSKYSKIDLKSRAFTVGGTSSIWSNISSYFEEFEMKPRWLNKHSNLWPITHNSLIKEYKKLSKNYQFHFNKLKKKNMHIPFQLRPFVATTRPINFKQFINFSEIDLIYNCKISTIDEKLNLAIANTINNFTFRAKKIVVCCGGIESVRLIQNSINQKKLKKIKNKHLVGKYFMDHPKFDLGYIKYPKDNIIEQIEVKKNNEIISYQGVSLNKEIQNKNKLLNTYVRFEKLDNRINKFLDKFKIPILKKLIIKKNVFRVRIFCEMKPSIKNLITSKKNKTVIKLKLSKTDYDTIKILSHKIKFFFSLNPKKENTFISKNFQKQIQNASHHMGGLRFDPNAKLSVVNRNLKIIGLKNTYICSSAIFPTSGSVNPTMTICALANRLGDFLNKYL